MGWPLLWNEVQACQEGSLDFSLTEGSAAGHMPVSTVNDSTLLSKTPFSFYLDEILFIVWQQLLNSVSC